MKKWFKKRQAYYRLLIHCCKNWKERDHRPVEYVIEKKYHNVVVWKEKIWIGCKCGECFYGEEN